MKNLKEKAVKLIDLNKEDLIDKVIYFFNGQFFAKVKGVDFVLDENHERKSTILDYIEVDISLCMPAGVDITTYNEFSFKADEKIAIIDSVDEMIRIVQGKPYSYFEEMIRTMNALGANISVDDKEFINRFLGKN